jgi:hypothetical protein
MSDHLRPGASPRIVIIGGGFSGRSPQPLRPAVFHSLFHRSEICQHAITP